MSLGDTKLTRASNWQDSGDRSQSDPHSWLSRSGRPETREANVKCTDKLKATWMSVDIVISEGNIYRRQTVSITGYLRWLKKI
ncbi:hypothetical protein Prudu_014102 [Prunus dulcis]|uniref:Uncharacterized protein n=1 Tax=Prunus dulcis TaxID=3755 RepID=A0A4Y1RHB2_PRUDU|nr:hypothetical protein Prudu_014102 [Prunus dulcis]